MDPLEWSLRDEILALLRRWYWLVAFLLLGGLLGWLASLALPARYEAEAGLSVSFNSDAIYRTPDDYKNWQVAELSDFVLSAQVLSPTLEALQSSGGPWEDWTAADLREAVEPRWRNAGVWQLVAMAGDPDQASAIVSAWREAALAETAAALAHAALFDGLDRRLDAQARSIGLVDLDLADLREIHNLLLKPPAAGSAGAAVLAARLSNLRMGRLVIPGPLPEEGAPDQAIAAWFEAAAEAAAAEILALEGLRAGLLADYDALGELWLAERQASQGLSAYLLVEPHDDAGVTVSRIYAGGSLSLAGAVIGAMAWIGYRLAAVAWRGRHETDR